MPMEWKQLTKADQLDEIVERSATAPILIFKHSTGCMISVMVLKRFESEFPQTDFQPEAYYLDLLQHRAISDEIAHRFNVFHHSPQVLLIKNGAAVYDASHGQIEAGALASFA